MSSESEVYLLSQQEAEALVRKSHQEVLNWVKETLTKFPEYSVEQILETAQNTIANSRVDLGDDYSELGDIDVTDVLNSITKETIDAKGLTVASVVEDSEDVTSGGEPSGSAEVSIFDALVEKTGIDFDDTSEVSPNSVSFGAAVVQTEVNDTADGFEANVDTEEIEVVSVADVEEVETDVDDAAVVEMEPIFDALVEKTGLSFDDDDDNVDNDDNGDNDDNVDADLESEVSTVDDVQPEDELIFDTLAAEKGLSFTNTSAVEETSEIVEDEPDAPTVDNHDSDTSIFDALAASAGLDLTRSEEETVEPAENVEEESSPSDMEENEASEVVEVELETSTANNTDSDTSIFDTLAATAGLDLTRGEEEPVETAENIETVETVEAVETVENLEKGETEVGVDNVWDEMLTSSEIVEEEQKIEEGEIVDDSVGLDWFETPDGTSSEIVSEEPEDEEELILAEIPHAETPDSPLVIKEESLEETNSGETTDIEQVEDLTEEEEEEEEESPAVTVAEPVIENSVINRYEYVDNDEDKNSEDGETVEEEVSLYKEYSPEEAGEIINNTLKTQEFDANKKLVSQNSGSDVEYDMVNKAYEPGEEYTIVTENIIEKAEEENPEQLDEYGSDVNISLGSNYEAPEEEQVVIPESEITVDVADINSEIKKRKLFGKNNDEPESYDEDAVIPVAEIDEEELNVNANSEGLSREGRNIGLSGMGSNEIEISDDVYEAQQEGLTARDFSEQNNEDMDVDTNVESEQGEETDDEDEEKQGVVRKDLNTRQLIKDVKIIDSF